MCIVYLAIRSHPDWPVFIAANRDEFHDRAALPLRDWPDHPDVIAGRDCTGGGTWLGVTRTGRFALLTNFRDPGHSLPAPPSRGQLVSRYVTGTVPPAAYAEQTVHDGHRYNGFNLIVGDLHSTRYVTNREGEARAETLAPGRHVLSNHLLNTPWPKARRLKEALDGFSLDGLPHSVAAVFALLKDVTPATDAELPRTGLSADRERLLSSPFIISPDYGTRCSTVFALHASGKAFISEITYDPQGGPVERHDWPFFVATRDPA